ncbi:Small subunit (SSU) processome component [Cyanidiococcus yangmingshanensis]|uniref:Small subunit (SSU) processome component n=1 Tax=Cyanidiococcus yangmingshanensis TaxID=2690220 RepID=A0A7J7IF30_9RHOD|nr:Small subunit (SSU) processome component [Cyanidiococcus yangmingshanensis]
MRKLRYHEYKLLKKDNLYEWRRENHHRAYRVVRRYYLPTPELYHTYNQFVGKVTALVSRLKALDESHPVRVDRTAKLLNKLYELGVINTKTGLDACANVTVSALCRRRLPTVLVRNKFVERLSDAVALIKAGHVRIGPQVVRDPNLLVTRSMEDLITWADDSKIREIVERYRGE